MSIPFDYHTHHDRCGHAEGKLADYIESAAALGITDLGVSDHCPALFLEGDHPLPGTTMALSGLPGYVNESLALKERYQGRVAVKVGIEADFVPGFEAAYRDLLAAHPFDYALGSVHWVFGVNIFHRPRWETDDAEATYTEYYRLVAEAARSGMFDILSHLTAVEAYGPRLGDALADRLYRPVVEAAVAAGAVVEINTSGFRKMGGDDPFPDRRMLRLLIEAGVPLTFGSDAHRPGEVGFARDRVFALLGDLAGGSVPEARAVMVRRGPIRAWAF